MRIVCIGGGPAGLYFAALAKLRDPSTDITVIERNPERVTYGWGVSYSFLLSQLQANDPVSARRIRQNSFAWRDQEVLLSGSKPIHLGGNGYNIGRHRLLDILSERALELGVRIEYQREVTHPSQVGDADLIVACDGVRSRLRQLYAEQFGPSIVEGRNKYIWLGTSRRFDAFTYAFERTDAGWIWFYGYTFDEQTSTFVVECCEQTWRDLGLDRASPEQSTAMLEGIFARHLDGHALVNQVGGKGYAPWLSFLGIRNENWVHDNIVLMGDAAHTAHFSIGSGTTLAMEDGIALAQALAENDDVSVALKAYEQVRQPQVADMQSVAGKSATWFENVPDCVDQSPVDFAYSLLRRRHGAVQPREQGPRWRYGLHLATQNAALRQQRRLAAAVRSRLRPNRYHD